MVVGRLRDEENSHAADDVDFARAILGLALVVLPFVFVNITCP